MLLLLLKAELPLQLLEDRSLKRFPVDTDIVVGRGNLFDITYKKYSYLSKDHIYNIDTPPAFVLRT